MPASVLVVDDSAIYRNVIGRTITQTPGLTLADQVASGQAALEAIPRLQPDLMTLDLEMPILDGLGVLRALDALPRTIRRPRVVLFSAHGSQGAVATLEALRLGAADFILKPTAADGMAAITDRLIPRLLALMSPSTGNLSVAPAAVAAPAAPRIPDLATQRRVLTIAASTGGPQALEQALKLFPASFPIPIVIAQHMPPMFTAVMAQHLAKQCRIRVVEGVDGAYLEPGTAYIAPGDWHMAVALQQNRPCIALNQGERIFGLRPAADALFPSIAEVFGRQTLAAIFTGMGVDGSAGARLLRAKGAAVLTQEQGSCVVYSMPQAVDKLGLSDAHFTPAGFYQAVTTYRLAW